MDSARVLREALADRSRITALVGTMVGFENGRPVIDVGGGRIPVESFASVLPVVNEDCWVWFVNSTPFLMGPSGLRPGVGTVTAIDGDYLILNTVGGNHRLPFYSWYTASVGDEVGIEWSQLPRVAGVLSTQPEPAIPPPPPGPAPGENTQVFTAVDAGSWHPSYGFRQAQVWASDTLRGFWFYGSKIPDTIPGSAVILSIELYISPVQIQGSAPNFAVHPYAGKPGGAPGFSSAVTPIAVRPGWNVLPVGFGNALKAGGGSLGVGVNRGGFNKFAALGADPQSGALRIRYRT